MAGRRKTITVALDATVIIHLAEAGRLDILGALDGYRFVVPDQVVEEVSYPEQAGALERALAADHLRTESCTDPAEMALYAELRQRMGRGEAACLAMAATRGWMLASDDRGRAFRRMVRQRMPVQDLIDTIAIVKVARGQGILSADEAARIERRTRE